MNIYLVSRTDKVCYDEYAEAVLYAMSEADARAAFRMIQGYDNDDTELTDDADLKVIELATNVERKLDSVRICVDYNAG